MGRKCSTNGSDEKYIYKVLVGKREGKILLGITMRRWGIILEYVLVNRVEICELDASG
jgi:hypothetical protein